MKKHTVAAATIAGSLAAAFTMIAISSATPAQAQRQQ